MIYKPTKFNAEKHKEWIAQSEAYVNSLVEDPPPFTVVFDIDGDEDAESFGDDESFDIFKRRTSESFKSDDFEGEVDA